MNKKKLNIKQLCIEALKLCVIFFVVLAVIKYVIQPVQVIGKSMSPTYKENNMLIMDKLPMKYEANDIIVFRYENKLLIKRVIAIPGDTIQIINGSVYINESAYKDDVIDTYIEDAGIADKKVTLGNNEYFVMGDNRNNSYDSRFIGCIQYNNIEGKVIYKIPFL